MYIAICDDEEAFANDIKVISERYFKDKGVDCKTDVFNSGVTLLESKNIEKYEVALLDVQMDGLNGIETAKQLRLKNPFVTIAFISSILDYAMYGYTVHAVRYVLKKNLRKDFRQCIEAILDERAKYISSKRYNTISLSEIYYFESNLRKVLAYGANGSYEILQHISEIEKQTDRAYFRIHQSYLVNLKYVSKIHNYKALLCDEDGGSLSIVLPVSRAKFAKAKVALDLYKGGHEWIL